MEYKNIFELIPDSGRITADHAAEMAATNWDIFKEFLSLAFSDDSRWAQRASRVINFACVINLEYFFQIRSQLIIVLPEIKSTSVQRNLMKTLLDGPISENEEELGTLTSFCFGLLEKGPMLPAIQVYAMSLLARISEQYPGLEDELCLVLESRLDDESAGIQCRATQILNNIKKKRRNKYQ